MEKVLGMKREVVKSKGGDTRTSLIFGQNKINFRPVNSSQGKCLTGKASTPGSDDLCFLTDATPGDVAEHLRMVDI